MRVGLITVSDGVFRGVRKDESGDLIERKVTAAQDRLVSRTVVPDEEEAVAAALVHLTDELRVDLALTTGGTGLSPRDITPDVTLRLIEKEVRGIAEAMRHQAFASSPRAMLSRAVAGVRKQTLIINLPGSPKGVSESLDVVYAHLPHAVALIRGHGVDHA